MGNVERSRYGDGRAQRPPAAGSSGARDRHQDHERDDPRRRHGDASRHAAVDGAGRSRRGGGAAPRPQGGRAHGVRALAGRAASLPGARAGRAAAAVVRADDARPGGGRARRADHVPAARAVLRAAGLPQRGCVGRDIWWWRLGRYGPGCELGARESAGCGDRA